MPDTFYTQPANLGNFIPGQAIYEGNNMAAERRRVIVGWTTDGTPVVKFISGNSQEEVNNKIVQEYIKSGRIYEFMDNPAIGNCNKVEYTLREYSEKWMGRKRKLKQTTKRNYEKYLKKIDPVLGDKLLKNISETDVQALLDHYSDMSHKSLIDMKNVLHQILRYAISDGHIIKNPCDSVDIEIPSDRVKIREALPIEQFKDILSNLGKLQLMDRRFLGLIMYTGIRRGEALGLMWSDIDFENKTINICRNVTHPQQNTPVVTSPKTKAGTRSIPLDENLEKLMEHSGEFGYILTGENPMTLSAYRAMMERIKSTINLHEATPHTLRHSYLTYAVGETTDYKTLQGISGHSDLGTLMNRYAHPQQDKIQKLVESIHQRLTV